MDNLAEIRGASRQPLDTLQVGLIAALIALAALAWGLTNKIAEGMDMGPGSDLGSLSFYLVAWVAMMTAMMFPSISPMVRTYALIQRQRRPGRGLGEPTVAISAFLGGYLLSWTLFGLGVYVAFDLLRGLEIQAFSWGQGGPYLAGAVILTAACYQLTPQKDACLSRCRSPFDFLTERWRDGAAGALWLGLEHGGWCVGCCWALMAALFALGVMSIAWMVLVAALIAAEKLLPWKAGAKRGIAALLVVLGLSVALVPQRVPSLVLPNSVKPMRAMEAMRGERPSGGAMGTSQVRNPQPAAAAGRR